MDLLTTLATEFASILSRLRGEAVRSLSLQQMAEQVLGQLDGIGMSAGAYPMVNDFYTEADGSLAILFSMGGKLYKAPITVSGTTAILGSIAEVEAMFPAVRSIEIVRQADGRVRVLMVAAASALNRVGEIDSRALFDSFVANVRPHGFPQLRFYHDARLVMGQMDYVDRADNLYIASALLDSGELATAFADACEQKRGVWGCSIGFMPSQPPVMVELARGISIPVYTEGVNTEISVLPEGHAASWFTSIGLEVTRNMDDAKLRALALLLGDEEKAKKFAEGVDGTNRAIEEKGLVTRQEPVVEAPPVVNVTVVEAAPALKVLLDTGPVLGQIEMASAKMHREMAAEEQRHATTEAEKAQKLSAEQKAQDEAELATRILAGVTERLDKLEAAIAKLTGNEAERTQERTDLVKRLAMVETIIERQQQERAADMPARSTVSATYRPREANGGKPSAADVAAATLAKMK